MKVYLISHPGTPRWHKLQSWVDVDKLGDNGYYVRSIRAFIKKKDAKEWLKEKGWDHLEIKGATL